MSVSHLTVYSSLSRAGIPSDNANEVEQAMKQMVDTGLVYRGPALIGECVDALRRRKEAPSSTPLPLA